jgi:hypothetical protein
MVTILKSCILLHIEFMRHIGMPFASYVLQSRGDKTLVPGEIHGAEEQRCKRVTQMIGSR